VKLSVLASGSKGNSAYIKTNNHNILIDLGLTCLSIEKRLKELEVDPKSIDIVLLTHTHVDHTSALKVFMKKYKPIIYLTKKMYDELNMELENYEFIDDEIKIDTLLIETVKVSHDVECNGYVLTENDKSICYITDTGYIHEKNYKKITNKNIYVMESNHDVEMLMNGRYPYHLKQRILGSRGHLSNEDASYCLKKVIGPNTKHIFLAHLSEENNSEERAYEVAATAMKEIDNTDVTIEIAHQNIQTSLVTL